MVILGVIIILDVVEIEDFLDGRLTVFRGAVLPHTLIILGLLAVPRLVVFVDKLFWFCIFGGRYIV